MAAADNIAKALSLKEEGNTCFKAGDYKGAMAAYHQIFMYVHGFSASSGGPMGMHVALRFAEEGMRFCALLEALQLVEGGPILPDELVGKVARDANRIDQEHDHRDRRDHDVLGR